MRTAAPIIAVTVLALHFASPVAKEIPAQKPDAVQGKCGESGGTHFPKTGPNSTYGCINDDGSGIVCGGMTAKDKRTCETFRRMPPRLPTRSEAAVAGRDKGEAHVEKRK